MSAVVYLDAPHTASSSLCQYTNAAVSRRYRSSIHRLARQPWSSTDTISAIGTVVIELLSPNVFGVSTTTKSPSTFTSQTVPRSCRRDVSSNTGTDCSNDTISADRKTVDNDPSSVDRCHPTNRL
jgi:hypothetical protein